MAVADHAADCLETWELNHKAQHPRCRLLDCDLSTDDGVAHVIKAVGRRRIDLVVGAIPCEQVSTARANRPLKAGEMDNLRGLIRCTFEIVKTLKPRWWCFEDVREIEPHLPSPLFDLDGVDFKRQVINAGDYGPQKRLRLFFGEFPDPAPAEPGPRTLGEVLRPGPYRTLPQLSKYIRSKSKWYGGNMIRVQETEKPGATVISSQGGAGSRAERSGMVSLAGTWSHPSERYQDGSEPSFTVTSGTGNTAQTVALEPRGREKPAPADKAGRTVVGGGEQLLAEQDQLVRVLEWQEAALLQGFPTDYVFAASWSRTWKLVAQAIPIQVGRAILQSIVSNASGRKR